MKLPEYIMQCISRLEDAGFNTFAVGGCVRDSLLGCEPFDYDLCTAATPEQIEGVFSGYRLILAGKKHGTVSVITHGAVVEITTFRTEGGYEDNRHPQWVKFVSDIESDLARRDFTVNAMAYSPTRGLADPFGGREDLRNQILRCVGDPDARFREDSLRILRGMRFAVRYRLSVEAQTLRAMEENRALMDNLARERVFDELCKLLPLVAAEDLLRFAPLLEAVIPELAPMRGFDQHSPHHAYDLLTHTAHVTAAVPPRVPLRFAALLHDAGKIATFTRDETGRGHFYGHAEAGAGLADSVLRRLKAPTALRGHVVALIGLHMTALPPDKKVLRRRLSRLGPDMLHDLLDLQEADMGSKGTGSPEETGEFPRIRMLLREIESESACLSLRGLAVNGSDLIALGFPAGPLLGRCLQYLLDQVIAETLKNEKDTLLDAARSYLENSK